MARPYDENNQQKGRIRIRSGAGPPLAFSRRSRADAPSSAVGEGLVPSRRSATTSRLPPRSTGHCPANTERIVRPKGWSLSSAELTSENRIRCTPIPELAVPAGAPPFPAASPRGTGRRAIRACSAAAAFGFFLRRFHFHKKDGTILSEDIGRGNKAERGKIPRPVLGQLRFGMKENESAETIREPNRDSGAGSGDPGPGRRQTAGRRRRSA